MKKTVRVKERKKQKESVKSLFIRNLNFKSPIVIAVFQIFNVSWPVASFWLYRKLCSKAAFLVKNVRLTTGENGDAAAGLNNNTGLTLHVV